MRHFFYPLLSILLAVCSYADIPEYAGLPRLFIYTENEAPIVDRETDVQGNLVLQELGNAPKQEIATITIRCRGNSSFKDMPKHSYRIHTEQKTTLLGMPAHKNWALITNYADRSMIRNKITYTLAKELGANYTPRTADVEVFINDSYEGVYLLAEIPKVGKERINIETTSYLIEIDKKYHKDDNIVLDSSGRPFNIKFPKHPTKQQTLALFRRINAFESFLSSKDFDKADLQELSKWIELEDYIRFYWIQEVSKNPDYFLSSTYFTWDPNDPIKMGPVWDFDVAYGIYPQNAMPMDWSARKRGWNKKLFKNKAFEKATRDYWNNNKATFRNMLDTMDVYSAQLTKAAQNNYSRWPILQSTENRFHAKKYGNHIETVHTLKRWYKQRLEWIDKELGN